MITHEEARRAFGNAMVSELEDECNFNCDIVEKYFKQQEKFSKLLGLYQKRDANIDHLTCGQINDLDRRIDELEASLNE